MKSIIKILFPLFLIIANIFSLFSCAPGLSFKYYEYLRMKEEGYYPEPSDFPDTKWVCREADMYFRMFAFGDYTMLGEYSINGETYIVRASIMYSQLYFSFYSDTDLGVANNLSFEHINYYEVGFLNTEYIYEDGIISCKIINSDDVIWHYKGDTITFENSEKIAQEPISCWYCEELDMHLEFFDDGYCKGSMIINGDSNYVHAIEFGDSGYYMFSIENGKINNLKENTISPLVNMTFEYSENQIIATVVDETIDLLTYPYWSQENTVFIFNRINEV